jgi:hypothetical protein
LPVNDSHVTQEHADGIDRKSRNTKRAAAREAAQAASCSSAQKRGAHTQRVKGDSAKPFLFRNKTGMRFEFCVLVDSPLRKSDEFRRRVIEAGCVRTFRIGGFES